MCYFSFKRRFRKRGQSSVFKKGNKEDLFKERQEETHPNIIMQWTAARQCFTVKQGGPFE